MDSYLIWKTGDWEQVKAFYNEENVDSGPEPPIHMAVMYNQLHLLEYLVKDCQANLHLVGFEGRPAFSQAIHYGHIDCAQFLLKECQDKKRLVTKCDNKGVAPIHEACRLGNVKFVKLLAQQEGVSVKGCCDNHQNTCLHFAVLRLEHMLETQPWIIVDQSNEILEWLIRENDMDVDAQNKDGITPLHLACRFGHLCTVRFLIEEAGASLSPTGGHKTQTPLHYASSCQNINENQLDLIKYLVEQHNVNVNAKDSDGNTPLNLSIIFQEEDASSIVKNYLIHDCNANIRLRTDYGDDLLNHHVHLRVEGLRDVFQERQTFLQQRWDLVMYLAERELL